MIVFSLKSQILKLFSTLSLFILIFINQRTPIYAAIVINEIMPHPSSGSDWIELYNTEIGEIDISGWKIEDSTGVLETFPEGTKTSSSSSYLQISKSNRLNNGGDLVRIKDKLGAVIDEKSYDKDPGVGVSIGRYPDGSSNWGILLASTPNSANANFASTPTSKLSSTPTLAPTTKLSNTSSPSATSKPQNSPTPTPKPTITASNKQNKEGGVMITEATKTDSVLGESDIQATDDGKVSKGSGISLPILAVLLSGGAICIGVAVFLSIKKIKKERLRI